MSADVTGLFVIIMIVVAMLVYVKSSSVPVKFICSMIWFLPLAYLTQNPPASIPAGSAAFTIIILLCIGFALILAFNAFRQPLQMSNSVTTKNGTQTFTKESLGLPSWSNSVRKSMFGETGRERANGMRNRNAAYNERVSSAIGLGNNNQIRKRR